jgi:prepilin-type N-terminal cleavage/methylation domain-containing protein
MRIRTKAFTIVELLIVIVVIGILAAITLVAYSNIQARATDSRMNTGVKEIEKAIYSWHTQTSEQPRGGWSSNVALSGSNCTNGSGGWVFSGAYACSLEDMLAAEKVLQPGFTRKLPVNKAYGPQADGAYSVMFYPCGSNRYALFWHVLNPTAENTSSLTAAESAGCPTSPRTTYGMKAAKIINL